MATQDNDAKPTPGGPERAGARDVERVAYWLDDAFTVPGTRFRVGFDGLAGLVPGVGDALVTVPALWIVMRAIGAGVPNTVVARMVGNVLLDSVLGTVPVVGDLFDFAWKANRRNARLLARYQQNPTATRRRSAAGLLLAAVALVLLAVLLVAIPLLLLAALIRLVGLGAA